MKTPLVSIIVVNYNGKKLLKTILDSLFKSEFRDFEVLVLDNASTDGSQEFVKRYKKVILVQNRENMAYSGINTAIKHCRGKYILFLNNDMEIPKESIGKMVEKIEGDETIGMVIPKLVNFYDKSLVSGGTWLSRAFYNGHIPGDMKSSDKVAPYLGVGMVRKSIVDRYGYLFDPDYFIYGEDVDLGLRIRLLGKKVVFSGSSAVYHMHAYTTSKIMPSSRTTFLMERNLLTSMFKNLPLSRLLLYLPYVLGFKIVAMLKDIASLHFSLLFSRIKAVLWILFNFGKVVSKRRQTQKHRKATTKFIMEIFNEKYLFRKKFIV